ncbi:hypothetical protein KC329_g112 [Hortaea werneckii]|nr:hypothetical protein KC329_g112 [Hortaea werneckii]
MLRHDVTRDGSESQVRERLTPSSGENAAAGPCVVDDRDLGVGDGGNCVNGGVVVVVVGVCRRACNTKSECNVAAGAELFLHEMVVTHRKGVWRRADYYSPDWCQLGQVAIITICAELRFRPPESARLPRWTLPDHYLLLLTNYIPSIHTPPSIPLSAPSSPAGASRKVTSAGTATSPARAGSTDRKLQVSFTREALSGPAGHSHRSARGRSDATRLQLHPADTRPDHRARRRLREVTTGLLPASCCSPFRFEQPSDKPGVIASTSPSPCALTVPAFSSCPQRTLPFLPLTNCTLILRRDVQRDPASHHAVVPQHCAWQSLTIFKVLPGTERPGSFLSKGYTTHEPNSTNSTSSDHVGCLDSRDGLIERP